MIPDAPAADRTRASDLPDAEGFRAIGRPVRRKEDERLLTGQGRFTDDFSCPGQLHAVMVRSPHPHARIRGVDKSRALALPGVRGVYTGADCLAAGLKPIPHDPVPSTRYDMKLTGPGGSTVFIGPHLLLPVDKARHVGEAVAMVVADTLAQALDGAEAVEVDYEPLPFNTRTAHAPDPGVAAVWDEVPDNTLVDSFFGDAEATARAFAAADHVVAMDFHADRVTAVTLEPRAALADIDLATGKMTLYAGSGGAVRQKRELSHVMGLQPEKLRVLSFDVGGNFGSRNRVYVEFGLVLFAARELGRPVKFTATRSEAFLTDYQGRDLVIHIELALTREGRFLGLRADNVSNVGMRCASLSPLGKGSALVTGSYAISAATVRSRAVYTNTMCTQAYRSSGRPEVNYALERIIDIAAQDLGFDRFALRRMNLIPPTAMPYDNAVGAQYDSGTYESNMDKALRLSDFAGFPQRKAEAAKRGRLLGYGFANYVESSIGSPRERAEVRVKPDGTVDVVIGTQPSGQGHETSFAQVAADLIGVDVAAVTIILGDTDRVSVGGGSHSGRSMRHAGTVISLAAKDLFEKGRRLAALVFGCPPEAVEVRDKHFVLPGTNHSLHPVALARAIEEIDLPEDLKDGLFVARDNEMHEPVFPNGAAACEVEIDPETGGIRITRYTSVDDVGRCINPLIVDGQTHGAIAQGVGEAMWELCKVDHDTGQPLAGSLMDYAMPRADGLPSFITEIVEVLSPTNPLGIKAGGEGGTTPALSVITNGVVDALSGFGVRDIAMPATPHNIWLAIQRAKAERAKTQETTCPPK